MHRELAPELLEATGIDYHAMPRTPSILPSRTRKLRR